MVCCCSWDMPGCGMVRILFPCPECKDWLCPDIDAYAESVLANDDAVCSFAANRAVVLPEIFVAEGASSRLVAKFCNVSSNSRLFSAGSLWIRTSNSLSACSWWSVCCSYLRNFIRSFLFSIVRSSITLRNSSELSCMSCVGIKYGARIGRFVAVSLAWDCAAFALSGDVSEDEEWRKKNGGSSDCYC